MISGALDSDLGKLVAIERTGKMFVLVFVLFFEKNELKQSALVKYNPTNQINRVGRSVVY